MKHVIFDLGAVMFDWKPEAIAAKFTNNIELQHRIQTELYCHQDWLDFDCAVITEKEAIKRASERLQLALVDTEHLFKKIKQSLVLISKTYELLKKVKERNLTAYCLSNISPETFQYLVEQHELFELFDGIVTSGAEKMLKPDKRLFQILFTRYQLEPKDCLFIDDSVANTASATELGITAITFKGTADCYRRIYSYI